MDNFTFRKTNCGFACLNIPLTGLTSCTRPCISLDRASFVDPSVRRSVVPSVRRSVGPSMRPPVGLSVSPYISHALTIDIDLWLQRLSSDRNVEEASQGTLNILSTSYTTTSVFISIFGATTTSATTVPIVLLKSWNRAVGEKQPFLSWNNAKTRTPQHRPFSSEMYSKNLPNCIYNFHAFNGGFTVDYTQCIE